LQRRATVQRGVVEVQDHITDGRNVDLVRRCRHLEVPRADGPGVLERYIALVAQVAGGGGLVVARTLSYKPHVV
jgi:hypothetical protein